MAANPEQYSWDASLFGAVHNGLLGATMTPTTYPRFVTTPNGKLLLLLRHGESGAGDSFLYEYEGDSGRWSGLGRLVDGFASSSSSSSGTVAAGTLDDFGGRTVVLGVATAPSSGAMNLD